MAIGSRRRARLDVAPPRPRRHRGRRIMAGIAVLLLAALVVVGYVAWTASTKLISLPRERIVGTPARYHLTYRDVSFRSGDGTQLRGWFVPAATPRPAPVLVLSHGRGTSREEFLTKLPVFHRHGFALLAFDYRACGQSGGTYTTAGDKETADLVAAVGFARRQPGVDAGRVAVVGQSQGAAVALLAAARDPDIHAVVEDSGFASLTQVIAYNFREEAGLPAFPFAPATILLAELRAGGDVGRVAPIKVIGRVAPRPVLVIHGLADTKVRPDQGEQLYAAARSPKAEWLVPRAGHVRAFDVDPAGYERRVVGFLDRALAVRAA